MGKDKKRVTWQCGCRDHGGVMVQQWVPGDLDIDEAIRRIEGLKAALEAIVKHQEIVCGKRLEFSTITLIAERALNQLTEDVKTQECSVNAELLGVLMEVLEDGLKTNMIDWQRRANTAVTKALWKVKNKD